MTVAIYSAHWASLGGGEKYVTCIAEVLAKETDAQVTILVDDPRVDRRVLERLFNVDLSHVEVRSIRGGVRAHLSAAHVSVVCSNVRPFGGAGRRIYILQIPHGRITLGTTLRMLRRGKLRESLKAPGRWRLVRDARRADLVLVYSDFVREVLEKHHGIRGHVLYPPVADFWSPEVPKRGVVLSVGRFFSGPYNEKRHEVLIDAFKQLRLHSAARGWEYHVVGTCRDDGPTRRYLARLRRSAEGAPITFHCNIPYDDLRRLYAEATLFWHAAGFQVDEARTPERVEHFGMSTAEAMSAGCIPLVVGRGGQREIVSHGRSGFLWETPQELVALSLGLINNPASWPALREGTRDRAREFSRERFSRRLRELLGPLREDLDRRPD